ncbi:hypothetical protein [Streptomyces antibioticus]|uniref:hypothetical protein n=1 Tax=Streptomyces antibioticus TaxID=1890 RepID=UPI0036D841A3
MATRRRGPTAQWDPDTTSIATNSVAGSADATELCGLTWDEFRTQWARERARREMALGSIREHLAEQPTPRSIRAVARLWRRDIAHVADELAQARQDQEHDA